MPFVTLCVLSYTIYFVYSCLLFSLFPQYFPLINVVLFMTHDVHSALPTPLFPLFREQSSEVLNVETVIRDEAPLNISEQSALLVSFGVVLVLLFFLFAVATDWGSAHSDSKSCCFTKQTNSPYGGSTFSGHNFSGNFGGGFSKGFNGGGVNGSGGGGGVGGGGAYVAAGGSAFGRAQPVGPAAPTGSAAAVAPMPSASEVAAAAGGMVPTPALLTWKDLSYAVGISRSTSSSNSGGGVGSNGGSGGAGGSGGGGGGSGGGGGGGGPLSYLPGGRNNPEFAVLSKVSGFAGPRRATGTAVPCVTKSLSYSSVLSASLESSHRGSMAAAAAAAASGLSGADDDELTPAPTAAGSSTLTGILGPSGAGKTSLLDILAGRKRAGEGYAVGSISIMVDGSEGGEEGGSGRGGRGGGSSAGDVRRVAGYVPQEDVLPGTLSCFEHLMFHARLRMPREATHAERRARALLVLEELGLTRVADSRIGDAFKRGISGGEKRRLSIGAELMAHPPLLFLDEPTTGLGETGVGCWIDGGEGREGEGRG